MKRPRFSSKREKLDTGEYQRSDGTYEFKWVDSFGERHSIYAKTLKQLREKKKNVQTDELQGIKFSTAKLNDYYNVFCTNEKRLKATTFENYKAFYRRYIFETLGRRRIKDIAFSDVLAFYNALLETRGIRFSTLKNLDVVLARVFMIAVRDGVISSNPTEGALRSVHKTSKNDSRTVNALTIEEQRILEEYMRIHEPIYYPIVRFILWSGLRASEATGLRDCDVDLSENIIHVDHSLAYFASEDSGSTYSITSTKTTTSNRIIPLSEKAKAAVLAAKDYQQEHGITCTSEIDGYNDFIFLNSKGHVFNYKKLNSILDRVSRRIRESGHSGFPHVSTHRLRHSFATRMHEAEVKNCTSDYKSIAATLGHKNPTISFTTYISPTQELMANQIARLEAYYDESADE